MRTSARLKTAKSRYGTVGGRCYIDTSLHITNLILFADLYF